MSKVGLRLFEGFSLSLTPDAPDGSAVAMSNADQSILGGKAFEDGFKVGQDVSQADKSLIQKADMDNAVLLIPSERVDEITLTSEMIAAKSVTLAAEVSTEAGGLVKMTTEGSPDLMQGLWFDVTGNALSWADYPLTSTVMLAGAKIYVRYIGL